MYKRTIYLVTLMAALALVGCAEIQNAANDPNYVPSVVELTRIAVEMEEGPLKATVQSAAVERYVAAQLAQTVAEQAQATANAANLVAQQQVAMMTAEAGATSDALAVRATTQALNVNATAQAQAFAAQETRIAQGAQETASAISAQATREAERATAQAHTANVQATTQAVSVQATATADTFNDTATRVAVGATMTATHNKQQVESVTRPLLGIGGILILAAFVGLVFVAGNAWQRIGQDRARVVRRRASEAEPLIIYPHGYSLPLRTAGPVANTTPGDESVPLLAPSVAVQDATTARQQAANLVHAQQAGAVERAQNRVPNFIRVSPRSVLAQPQPIPTSEQWRAVEDGDGLQWPSQVALQSIFASKRPSLDHVVMGVAPQADGQTRVISTDIHSLMHTLAVGASGWGKSTWLRAFLWQIAQVQEPVDVVAIDISGSEFNALRGWGKLKYPVAESQEQARIALSAVGDELFVRRDMWKGFPLADSLTSYNRLSGDGLPALLVLIDEGAALFNEDGTGDILKEAVQTARQYGIYCVLTTVTATHKTIPTALRDQFSTRVCFRTSPTSSRVVLDDKRAGDLQVKGRAWVSLTGQTLQQIQAPWVTRADFLRVLGSDGPQGALPEPEPQALLGRVGDILALAREGATVTAIAESVFGYKNSRIVERVKGVIAQYNTVTP